MTTVPIQVYHNVAEEADRRIGGFGYQDGQPLVCVYKTDYTCRSLTARALNPARIAQDLYAAFNADPGILTGELERMRSEYRARKLQSLSIGDVVIIGHVPWVPVAVGRGGDWDLIQGDLNVLAEWPETTHTVIWRD
jgi:hypothetical protein